LKKPKVELAAEEWSTESKKRAEWRRDAKKKRLDAAVAEERRRKAEHLEALQSKASADALETSVAQ
jgi:hypothetical protein